MEGWLEKEGHNFKSWKRRYMVLSSVPSSRIMEGGYGGLSSMLGGGGGGDGADKDPSRYIQRYENNNPNDGCQIYYLSYYKDINKRYKCGEILITKNTAISNVLNGHIPGRINLFAILSTENKGHNYLLLSALTEDEKISWMQTIQTIIDTQVRESDYYQIINQSNLISNINNNKIEGWLEKEGQFIKSWKRRWMVFDPQLMLLSYSVEMDSIFKKGEFKLSNKSTIAPLKNGFVPGKMNLFVITSTFNRESILLSALTPEDRDRWISGIQKYLLKHQKRQTNYSTNSLISFPVNGVLPCTVEDIRTIQLLFSDILTAPPNLMPFADLTVHMRHVELFLSQYFSNEYVEFYGSYDLRNKTSFLRQIENWWFTIPDMRWSIQDIVVDGNKVAVWMIIRGSPHGTFYDLTDLDGTMSFTIMGLSIFTFVNSQIKSTYHLEDWNDALEQIKIATIKNKSRPSTHIPTHSILSISPSKLSPEIMLSRTPTTGDRVMSVSLRDSSYADILSSLNVPSPER